MRTGLDRFIERGEHQQQDFKMRIDSAKKIGRTLVAFANTDGGRLLIGVKDNGNLAGIRPQEEKYMIDAAAKMHCRPPVDYTPQLWKVEDKWILDVWIEPSDGRPHFSEEENGKWRAYVRRDDENLLANGVLLKTWEDDPKHWHPTFQYTEDEQRLFSYLNKRDKAPFKKCAQLLKASFSETEDILSKLILWEVLEQKLTSKGCWYALCDLKE